MDQRQYGMESKQVDSSISELERDSSANNTNNGTEIIELEVDATHTEEQETRQDTITRTVRPMQTHTHTHTHILLIWHRKYRIDSK